LAALDLVALVEDLMTSFHSAETVEKLLDRAKRCLVLDNERRTFFTDSNANNSCSHDRRRRPDRKTDFGTCRLREKAGTKFGQLRLTSRAMASARILSFTP